MKPRGVGQGGEIPGIHRANFDNAPQRRAAIRAERVEGAQYKGGTNGVNTANLPKIPPELTGSSRALGHYLGAVIKALHF